jgi:hypothetical protein
VYSPWPNVFIVANTTTSASVSSGALQVAGVVGVGGHVFLVNVLSLTYNYNLYDLILKVIITQDRGFRVCGILVKLSL